MRPDLLGICFVGIDVDHPIKNLRNPAAAGLVAGVFGRDRAAEAEFSQAGLPRLRAFGREADVDVLVPARHAQRDALIQLILGSLFFAP
jgi:hypothetical protein